MTGLLHESIKDPALEDWIMPNFTTTTDTDMLAASIIMMGTMQKYFVYGLEIMCGIPSVTLLGEESDWLDIHRRLDYLSTFASGHPQLAAWQSARRSLVSKMVETFRVPDSADVVRSWRRAVHASEDGYSGEKNLSGWILAFVFWDTDGTLLGGCRPSQIWQDSVAKHGDEWWYGENAYYPVLWNRVPAALVHVPIHVRDDNEKYMAKAVAGSIGYTVWDSAEIFQSTRQRGKKDSILSGDTLATRQRGDPARAFQKLVRKLLCFQSGLQTAQSQNMKQKSTDSPPSTDKGNRKWIPRCMDVNTLSVPQFSDLNELNEPWAYEQGGQCDTVQPVTGWWVIRTSEGQFGRDPDVPEVQFDRDAPDCDRNLAEKGRSL